MAVAVLVRCTLRDLGDGREAILISLTTRALPFVCATSLCLFCSLVEVWKLWSAEAWRGDAREIHDVLYPSSVGPN